MAHRMPPDSYFADPPLAFAHRGGATYPPNLGRENTLAAFQAALELGITHLETDVHATADGHLVALHDERLDRVSDRSGAVADLTLHEVRQARIGGEPIPTLAEVLALPAFINIDIKAPRAVRPLVALLREMDAGQRVCVGSFSDRSLWRFRALTRGRVPTAAGRLGVVANRLLPAAITRLVHSPARAYQVPHRLPVGPFTFTVVTPAFIRNAHRDGAQVHVWTIDDPQQMHELLDLGVDGIVSDRPDLLAQVLAERAGGHTDPRD
ncbi:glycerophosphodiester phosphodiesterase [Gephyromycinifex aptenodytis]|uniref:glycerophosphodiester phosphodiesterase n=1 Tax=Gephyromycinifex aptenodytis TaxID=2716227 RepID=UPI001D0274B8|nr:glycerophosphodiester phosphodiesterase [Gephyromycinifex aptenodytis]